MTTLRWLIFTIFDSDYNMKMIMVIIIMYMCMYYRILNSYNNDKNIKSLFFFKFSRWHDNVSADADDDHNNC